MKRILALIVCLLSAQMMMAQTTELQAKRVRALDSVFINGRWIKSVGIDTSLTGTNRDLPSIEAVRLHIANRINGIAGLYSTKTQLQDSIAAIRLLIGNGGSLDWTAGFPVYDARYPSITRFLDTSANIWSRVQTTYQVAQANYSTTYALSNDLRDTLGNRYTKAQSDARYLQSFTESDPVWSAAAANYYTKTQADARYLQSFTETDPTVYAWAKAATKPAYAVAEITGLQTALDAKEPVLGFTPVPNTRTINGYALSANISLTKTDVGLGNVPNTDATNPANISQSASYRFVTDTEKSTWNAKQNALGYTPENIANKGQANGYADLDANGKVPASRIDFSQTGQTFVVASQSAMLAVSGANVGAMAIRTDQSRTYVLIATPASTLSNWVQLLSPDAPVQSVNGQTGNVNLLTTNIGEGTNLYYTDARARAALSAGTGISYNNTTGQISSTITQYTDALARASLSFTAGSGAYNSSTGVITIPTNTSQLTNGAGFITGINSTMVTTALGYTPPQPNGTGATGTWGINISGNAATASNSTQWNGMTYSGSVITAGTPLYVMAWDGSQWRPANPGPIQSFLGLGSYAYRSSGLAELSGAAFTGAISAASFTSSSTANNTVLTSTGTASGQISRIQFYQASGSADARSGVLEWYDGATFKGDIRLLKAGGIEIRNPSDVAIFQLSSAGAVTATSLNVSTSAGLVGNINSTAANGGYLTWQTNGTTIADIGTATQLFGSGGAETFGINARGARNLAFGSNNTERLRITSAGNVGIGTTSPSTKLHVVGAVVIDDETNGRFTFENNSSQNTIFSTTTSFGSYKQLRLQANSWSFHNGSSEVATISSTGAATFSSSVSAAQFNGSGAGLTSVPWGSITGAPSFLTTAVTSATGTANQISVSASTGAVTFSLPSAVTISGNMTAAGFFESSDIRLKDVFQTYTSADEINTIQYTFKGEFKVKYGYSAQQVQKIIPSAVEVGSDGFYKVDYTSVHSYKIMMLEKRIADLERRVNKGLPERMEYFPINEEKMLTKAKQK